MVERVRLFLVRHGNAHAGLWGTIAGPRACQGLTDLGRDQASALGERVAQLDRQPEVLVSSELPRAIETAAIVAGIVGRADVPSDCALCEVHVGDADGLEWDDHVSRYGTFDMAAEPDRPFSPGGDSFNSFRARVRDTMDAYAERYAGSTVMAVCHAGVIAASLEVRLGIPAPGPSARLVPTNTGITTWDHDPQTGTWTLVAYDDTRHLHDTLAQPPPGV